MDEELQLFVVADGMGGHAAGEVAAQMVVDTLPEALREQLAARPNVEPAAILYSALAATSKAVLEEAFHSDLIGMGAAVVALWIHQDAVFIGHLGDCRAYLWSEEKTELLTRDHSLVELLIESGDITPQEAKTHPSRHQITRFCGMSGEVLPEVHLIDIVPGDRILLCSDGISNELEEEELA